jgi:PAS domain S-box-containing protein
MENRPTKVLAIDDNQDNLTTIKALVREAFPDSRTLTATNGREGITLAQVEDPDVILLDILMPGMDGFAVCRELKTTEAVRGIPVVFVTALKADKENRIRALEAGAEGFICKPIDESELTAQIRAMTKIKAAHARERDEKERLAALVKERTAELEKELTERKRVEIALRTSEDRFRRITEGITDYLYTVRIEHGRAVETKHSPACEKVTGYTAEEFAVHPDLWITMVPVDDQKNVIAHVGEILAGQQIAPIEHRIRRKNGEICWVSDAAILHKDDQGNLLSYEGVVKDITEKRAIESRLRQSEKMEAIGHLAGGIAHDFNNVLGGIIGYTDMSLEYAEKGSVLETNLHRVLTAGDRAKHLVRQILTFSQKGIQQKSVTAIRPIIKEVLELLRASIPSSVIIESDLRKDTKPVLADSTQIHEMILNLATNAVHAMARKGTLTVRLYTSVLDQESYGRVGRIEPGEYVVVEVADTGCGMDAQILAKAFDPFFTTKPVGEGTGMGLCVVLGVVQSHGGNLQVESSPRIGTAFKIYLPVTDLSASFAPPESDTSTIKGGTERILFVDDEKLLVELAEEMLGALGYRVTGICSSLEGLKFLQEKSAEIDILITDQTMPGMSGVELAKAALKIRNDLPIILCTGYSLEISPERVAAIGISRLAMKPLSSRAFKEIVREVLDQKSKGTIHGANTGH